MFRAIRESIQLKRIEKREKGFAKNCKQKRDKQS